MLSCYSVRTLRPVRTLLSARDRQSQELFNRATAVCTYTENFGPEILTIEATDSRSSTPKGIFNKSTSL